MTQLLPHLFFGLDLGQRNDPAALALLARIHELDDGFDPVTWQPRRHFRFYLIHTERIPLGTPYLRIVERVADLVRSASILRLTPVSPHRTLVVDASGVGAPIVELLRKAHLPATLAPITITGGSASHPDRISGGSLVPRRDLLTALRLLFEHGRLAIAPHLHDRQALETELARLADQVATDHHDDLAISTAMAAWQSTRGITL